MYCIQHYTTPSATHYITYYSHYTASAKRLFDVWTVQEQLRRQGSPTRKLNTLSPSSASSSASSPPLDFDRASILTPQMVTLLMPEFVDNQVCVVQGNKSVLSYECRSKGHLRVVWGSLRH